MDVTDIYSPERVTAIARKMNLAPGSAMDLTNGFYFSKHVDQLRAWEVIKREAPYLIIGSPMCTLFSLLQDLNIAQHGEIQYGWPTSNGD